MYTFILVLENSLQNENVNPFSYDVITDRVIDVWNYIFRGN